MEICWIRFKFSKGGLLCNTCKLIAKLHKNSKVLRDLNAKEWYFHVLTGKSVEDSLTWLADYSHIDFDG